MILKNRLFSYLFSISLILFLFLSGIDFCCFNRSFYNYQHERITINGQRISEYIGTDDEGLAELTDFLLSYLENRVDSLDMKMELHGTTREVFNQKEKTHMVDVKNLYLTAMSIRNISLVLSLASLIYLLIKEKTKSFSSLFYSFKKTLMAYGIVIVAIATAVIADFDSFWTTFHHFFFAGNDLWLLSLKTDVLIMIVPPEFFNNLLYFIIITINDFLLVAYLLLSTLDRKVANRD